MKHEVGSMEKDKEKTIRSFKDLHAWQEGHVLVLATYRLTKKFPKDELFALVSQMRRAVVSITSNIAEGFGRSSVRERAQFYSIAQGSTTELQNQFLVSKDVGYITDSEFESVDVQATKVHKILTGLIRSTKSYFVFFFLLLTSFSILPAPASASVILGSSVNLNALTSGLIGYWPLDGNTINWKTGTILDLSGSGNNGVPFGMGTTTSVTTGRIGQGLQFNGTTSYIGGFGDKYDMGTNNWTVSVWFKGGTLTQNGIIVSKSRSAVGDGRWTVYITTAGKIGFNMTDSGTVIDTSIGATTVTDNKWHHLVTVWNRTGNVIAYVDGKPDGTGGISGYQGLNMDNDLYFFIGTYGDAVGHGGINQTLSLKGTLDDVRIYNRALSAQEVALLYADGNVNGDHANTVSLSSGLVGYWPLDGSTINWKTGIVTDVSGTGSTGTIIGLATTTSPVAGKIGQALNFSSTGQISVTSTNLPVDRPVTISAWVYPTADAAGTIFQRGTYNYGFTIAAGGILTIGGIDGSGGSGYGSATSPTTIPLNKWTHVVAVDAPDNSFTLYVNGVRSVNARQNLFSGANRQNPTFIGPFTGRIDDVRVYNRTLSAQEVADLYAQGNSGTNADHSNTVTLSTGLVGYWTFDGNNLNWKTGVATDSSGNGNNGSLVGMSTTTSVTFGKVGQALNFTGSAQDVTTGKSVSTICSVSTCSMSVWLYPTGSSPAGSTAFGGQAAIGDSTGDMGIYRTSISGTDNIWAYNWDGSEHRVGTTYSTNTWTHIVWVHSNGTLFLYKNGVLVGSTSSGSETGAGNITIGRGYNPTNLYWTGKLDDVRIYNRALSAQEVNQLYLMGK